MYPPCSTMGWITLGVLRDMSRWAWYPDHYEAMQGIGLDLLHTDVTEPEAPEMTHVPLLLPGVKSKSLRTQEKAPEVLRYAAELAERLSPKKHSIPLSTGPPTSFLFPPVKDQPAKRIPAGHPDSAQGAHFQGQQWAETSGGGLTANTLHYYIGEKAQVVVGKGKGKGPSLSYPKSRRQQSSVQHQQQQQWWSSKGTKATQKQQPAQKQQQSQWVAKSSIGRNRGSSNGGMGYPYSYQ